jgi:hypothetical protein
VETSALTRQNRMRSQHPGHRGPELSDRLNWLVVEMCERLLGLDDPASESKHLSAGRGRLSANGMEVLVVEVGEPGLPRAPRGEERRWVRRHVGQARLSVLDRWLRWVAVTPAKEWKQPAQKAGVARDSRVRGVRYGRTELARPRRSAARAEALAISGYSKTLRPACPPTL